MPTVPQGTDVTETPIGHPPPNWYPPQPNMQSSVTGGRFCFTHGYYFGNTCPGCTVLMTQPPVQHHGPPAPTPDPLDRITCALERIATALEANKP